MAKSLARAAALIAVTPWLVSFWIRARVLGADRALEASTQLLALLPGLSGQYLRRAFLSRVLVRCHTTAVIEFGTVFSRVGAAIDERAYIGPRCHIGLAHIARDVLVAAGSHIPSGAHLHGIADPAVPIRDQAGVERLVRIGPGAWIGSAAIVMAEVGRDAIVGAGAVVTRPVPDGAIVAGVPARVVRARIGMGVGDTSVSIRA